MGLTVSKTSTLREAQKREIDLQASVWALELEKKTAAEREKARALAENEKILKEPWRLFESGGGWNHEYRKKLLTEIQSYEYYGDIEYWKLILLGPIMSGKSSFISSIASIDKGRIAQPTLAGFGLTSKTTKLHQYIPKRNVAGKYRLMDTMGIEEMEGKGFCIQDVVYLIQGNIAANYEFKPGEPINAHENPKFISKPTLKDKPQCIVIVTDSNMLDLDAFSDVVKQKLNKLQEYISKPDIPTVLVLTKIDDLCADDGIKITDIYSSRRINTVVTKASQIFGVPEMHIYPVQNYSKEQGLQDNMDILLLLALRGILNMACDYLEHLEDQTQ